MDHFSSTIQSQEIRFGSGSISELSSITSRFGWNRVALCTTGSMVKLGVVDRLRAEMGARLTVTLPDVQSHVQEDQLKKFVHHIEGEQVDAVIAIGGGSSLGMAKASAAELTRLRNSGPPVPSIAVPTTYAGSEMTSIFGVTRLVDGVMQKQTVRDPSYTPRVVIYDPDLTLDLPRVLTATSAMNALAHCFESLYTRTRTPLAVASALRGIRKIASALPVCHLDPSDMNARTDLMEGAFLAGFALSQMTVALHHGLCHVLGGTARVPHGVANTVVLPHALHFNREVSAGEIAAAAREISIDDRNLNDLEATDKVIEWIQELQKTLELPTRLRDVGVEHELIGKLAEIAASSAAMNENPRPVDSAIEMQKLIQAMW